MFSKYILRSWIGSIIKKQNGQEMKCLMVSRPALHTPNACYYVWTIIYVYIIMPARQIRMKKVIIRMHIHTLVLKVKNWQFRVLLK